MPLNFLNNGYFAGTVGIGTVSADYKLDIGGTVASTDNTARLMQNNGGTAIRIGSGGGSSDVVLLRIDGNSATGGHDGATDSSNYGFSFKYFGTGGGNNNRFGILSDNQVAATQVEAITILQDGFIGIGNTAPGYKLDVTGSVQSYISATRYIRLQGASADFEVVSDNNTKPVSRITGTGTADLFQIFDNTTEVFTVLDGGNVGIGTASPVATLVIQPSLTSFNLAGLADGQIAVGNNTGGGIAPTIGSKTTGLNQPPLQFITGQPNTSTVPGMIFSVREDNNSDFSTTVNKPAFDFLRYTTSLMRIDRDGNVGIGTTSPSYRLTAYGSSTNSEIVASFGSANDQNEYTAIGLSGFIASNGATKAGLALKRTGTYGTGELHFLNNNTLDNSDMTLSDSKMMINSSGNVGIGTTSPDFKLDVNGIIRSENSSEVGTLYLGNTAQSQIPGGAIIGQRSPSYSSTGNLLFQVPTWGAGTDYGLTTQMSIEVSTSDTKKATISMIPFGGNVEITNALLSNQENTDVDTGTETVANVAIATYTAAFFDFVIKKTTNVRSGTVYACHDGTNLEFTETSTQDLGDTSDVTLSVDISGGNMRLRATTTSDDWSVKSLIRAI